MLENLCLASTNSGKISEFKKFLKNDFKLFSLNDFTIVSEAEEIFNDFEKNAISKAKYYSNMTKMLTLSDDSGLIINSLNGFPGVYTSRFVAENEGFDSAYSQLEDLLKLKKDYSAKFMCYAVIFNINDGKIFSGNGFMEGEISFPARGDFGFAFDKIFVPKGYDKTIAELGDDVKFSIGHRGKAIRNLLNNYKMNNYTIMEISSNCEIVK